MQNKVKDFLGGKKGKVSVPIIIFGAVLAAAVMAVYFVSSNAIHDARFAMAQSTATTTVLILNTPPNWTANPYETPASATSSPTNVGIAVTWNAIGTDPNSDNYYLLICKASTTPTANNGAAPVCGAGGTWAVSTSTTSGGTASTSYVTLSTDPQLDVWFAWICDGNAGGAQCNAAYQQGSGTSGSPFVVNHRPNFTSFTNTSPSNPGVTVTWTAVASDTDTFTGATDTIQLFVCKASDWNGATCGAGGTYCSSVSTSTLNPTCTYTPGIPTQNQSYPAYGYIVDQHGFAAAGGSQGANSALVINEVAPTIASSSINLLNTNGSSTPLALTNPAGQTTGFQVTFTVSDNNSCLNPSSNPQVTSAILNVYRSGIGQANCQSGGQYNPNNCYPAAVGTTTWNFSCSQNGGSCAGSSSLTSAWTCTFPLWNVADPTGGTASSSLYYAQNWLASVKATDYLGTSSVLTESATGNNVNPFLAAALGTPSISFGALAPGSSTPTLATSTIFTDLGNTGVNETLYGLDMCTTFPGCSVSATSTIPVGQIKYGSSTLAYASGITLLTNPGALFPIQISKPTVTSTFGNTYWGIAIPGTIQLSGAYTGQNTFVAVTSNPTSW